MEFKYMCSHPRCYSTENDCTIYKVQSRNGEGSFTVCGDHLIERDVDRAEAIVTAEGSPADQANAEILDGLKN